MLATTMRVDGAVVTWSLAEYSYLAVLREGLINRGWEKHVPNMRTNGAILKDALSEVCGGARAIIRPLKSENGVDGFVVMGEERDVDENHYSKDLVAKIDAQANIKLRPYDDRAQPIVDEFNKQRGLVKGVTVAKSIVEIIHELGGTAIRPGGGFYWLPGYCVPRWQELIDVVESCGVSKNSVYLIRHELDSDAMRAVRDAIANEVTSEVDAIAKAIIEDELGDRALETKKRQAEGLRAKIKMYEGILNTGLDRLIEGVNKAEIAIAQATLIGSTQQVA